MAKTIAGFFRTQVEGEVAKRALYRGGFSEDEVSYLAGDTRGHQTPAIGPALMNEGSQSEAVSDAFTGGVIGLAAGVLALAIPGVGPFLAVGPLAAAVGGMTAGVATGGVIGLLKDHGISEDEAGFYAEGVKHGGALVTVHGVDEERETKARKILQEAGSIETEELADEWRRTGAQPQTFRAG
jgi:hypothetical protein